MTIHTIGFTRKSAETFFGLLAAARVERVIDVRLNNVSQLAGFAKRGDLQFFLRRLCGIDYLHVPLLAPTQDMLDEYKKRGRAWSLYERRFLGLMAERGIDHAIPRDVVEGAALLCSEAEPHHCHRRLVAEYLRDRWDADLEIKHLV